MNVVKNAMMKMSVKTKTLKMTKEMIEVTSILMMKTEKKIVSFWTFLSTVQICLNIM